jgi:hypothetical protein
VAFAAVNAWHAGKATALNSRAMRSKLALAARNELLEVVRRLSPEQRLNAFLEHCQLMAALAAGGRARNPRDRRSTP